MCLFTHFKEAAFEAANRVEPRVTLVPMLTKHRDGSFLFNSGRAFGTSTACSCDVYTKELSLVVSPDKLIREENWLGAGAGYIYLKRSE
jgi:hypothetical protein